MEETRLLLRIREIFKLSRFKLVKFDCINKFFYIFFLILGNIIGNNLQYHPLYLTDNEEGAFGRKSESEQKDQRIFGGISYDSEGNPLPNTGMYMSMHIIKMASWYGSFARAYVT